MRNYVSKTVGVLTARIPCYIGYGSGTESGYTLFGCEDNTIEFSLTEDATYYVNILRSDTGEEYDVCLYSPEPQDDGTWATRFDITAMVKDAANSGATLTISFYADGGTPPEGTEFRTMLGFEPRGLVGPPPYLPFHDEYDVLAFPLCNTPVDGGRYTMVAAASDGQAWSVASTQMVQCEVYGGVDLGFTCGGKEYYTPYRELGRQCETLNLRWRDRNGMIKAWVFELLNESWEVPDYSDILTGRGIGYRRFGKCSITATVHEVGASIELRRWLADLATADEAWAYRRYRDTDGGVSQELVPVTCEVAEIDFSERYADLEITINYILGR